MTISDLHSRNFILNCDPTVDTKNDWKFEDGVSSGVIEDAAYPSSKDLRASWWPIRSQGRTGACVGFATADGVLHYHFRKKRLLRRRERPSPRFIWMANKETDQITSYPTTFIESAGTQTKLALDVARKYGCVRESDLPMNGDLSSLSSAAFYALAARFRITAYFNLGNSLKTWRKWIATQGPILTRLGVDETWDQATSNGGHMKVYKPKIIRGGHAVCLVGYTKNYFIVRNSWGTAWGDKGFAYAHNKYAKAAFKKETYGAYM